MATQLIVLVPGLVDGARAMLHYRDGFDCRSGNCPACDELRSKGLPTADHGVSGGKIWYGLRMPIDGEIRAASLEVLDDKYPSTVPESTRNWRTDGTRYTAGMLAIHYPTQSRPGEDRCDWLDKWCAPKLYGYIAAERFFNAAIEGQSIEDLREPPSHVWIALAKLIVEDAGS